MKETKVNSELPSYAEMQKLTHMERIRLYVEFLSPESSLTKTHTKTHSKNTMRKQSLI